MFASSSAPLNILLTSCNPFGAHALALPWPRTLVVMHAQADSDHPLGPPKRYPTAHLQSTVPLPPTHGRRVLARDDSERCPTAPPRPRPRPSLTIFRTNQPTNHPTN